MRTFWHQILALAGLFLLAACAQPAIPYDRGGTSPVHSIAVLTPRWPDKPVAILASNVGQNFGLIGALAEAAMAESRKSKLVDILAAHHFVASDHFADYLRKAIATDGYKVVPVTTARPDGDYLAHYPPVPDVDAWLDCVGEAWGYLAAGIGDDTPYRPVVMLKCRLVRTSDDAVLMRDHIWYNPLGHMTDFVALAPDPSIAFATFDTLTADPDHAVAGIDLALHVSAAAVGTLLK